MHYRELIANVGRELPFPTVDGPERALRATLTALCEALPARAASALLAATAGAPQDLPRSRSAPAIESAAQLGARAAELLGEPLNRAIEEAQVVCRVLARTLSGEDRVLLLRALPAELAALFEPSQRGAPGLETGRGHTLADGTPGSSHPLSTSSPGSRRPLGTASPARAHAHSVAEGNPHGETKLSSARGSTQEREHESLSEGRSKRS